MRNSSSIYIQRTKHEIRQDVDFHRRPGQAVDERERTLLQQRRRAQKGFRSHRLLQALCILVPVQDHIGRRQNAFLRRRDVRRGDADLRTRQKAAPSDCNQMSSSDIDAEEAFCNAVAGEFLVPAALLERVVDGNDNLLDEKLIAKLAKRFSVSRDVIARRLYDMGHIEKSEYEQKLSIYDEEARVEREHQKAQRAAGIESFAMQPAYRLAADKHGSTFCETVLRAVEHGIYSEHDASKRLGISIDKLGLVFKEAML